MDRRVRQEAHRLSIPRPWRWGPSSDGSAAIEPPAEALGRRGGARSRGLQRRIFTADKGSPHLKGTGDLQTVRALLGHARIESTARYLGLKTKADPIAVCRSFDI